LRAARIVALAGLPGTGKSRLAAELARLLEAPVLDKDRVRAELFGERVDASREQDEAAMAAIRARVEGLARDRVGDVILDGRTYTRRSDVDELRAFAKRIGAELAIVECVCDARIARERIARDLREGAHPAPNRTPELHDGLRAAAEPIEEPKIVVDTGRDEVDRLARIVLAELRGSSGSPERRDRRAAWLLAACVFLVLAPGAFFGLPGKSVAGAFRILDGEVPYRDWWTMYAPGHFYVVAALLAVAGKQVIVPALAACAVRAGSAAVLFAILRKAGGPRALAFVTAAVLGASLFELAPELSSYPLAFLLIAWSLLELVRYVEDGRRRSLVRAGAALGVAAVFKHDVAAYSAVAFAVGLVLSRRAKARELVLLFAPAAAIVVVAIAWLAVSAGRDAWNDLIAFPLGDFRIVRSEPYPPLVPTNPALRAWLVEPTDLRAARDVADGLETWLLGNLPQLAFVLGIAFVASRRRALAPAKLATCCAMLAWMSLAWWAAHTQQNTHMTTMAVAAAVLGTIAWTESARWKPVIAALGLAYAAGLAIGPAMQLHPPLFLWSGRPERGLPRARWIRRERDLYRAVADFVEERVPRGEPIYMGVARHDAIVINNPRFAWLVGRPAATRYHELHPGVTDRDDVQREMIEDLERENVRCAVIWRFGWPEEMLDRLVAKRKAAIPECGATRLDRWLAERFEPVLERGEYVVLWRAEALSR
jgi:predicted kinase